MIDRKRKRTFSEKNEFPKSILSVGTFLITMVWNPGDGL